MQTEGGAKPALRYWYSICGRARQLKSRLEPGISLQNTIAFNDRESDTVHMVTQDGKEPTEIEIRALVAPFVRKMYHPSGNFEIEDITNV